MAKQLSITTPLLHFGTMRAGVPSKSLPSANVIWSRISRSWWHNEHKSSAEAKMSCDLAAIPNWHIFLLTCVSHMEPFHVTSFFSAQSVLLVTLFDNCASWICKSDKFDVEHWNNFYYTLSFHQSSQSMLKYFQVIMPWNSQIFT